MKKQSKWIIGAIAVVLVITATVVVANPGLFKGSIQKFATKQQLNLPKLCNPAKEIVRAADIGGSGWTLRTANKQYNVVLERLYHVAGNAQPTGDQMRADVVVNGDRLVGLKWDDTPKAFGGVGNFGDAGLIAIHGISLSQNYIVFKIQEEQCTVRSPEIVSFIEPRVFPTTGTFVTKNKRYTVTLEKLYHVAGNAQPSGDQMRADVVVNGDRLVGLEWDDTPKAFGGVGNFGDAGLITVHQINLFKNFIVFRISEPL